MNIHLSKRSLIRVVSFIVVIVVSLLIFSVTTNSFASKTSQKLEYQYLRSISSLSEHLKDVETSLIKLMYASSPSTISDLSHALYNKASFAKDSMSALPLTSLNLENTYKFLSQVGDYCTTLSDKVAKGEEISKKEFDTLTKFREYAESFLKEVLILEDGINTGNISLLEVKEQLGATADKLDESESPNLSDGFTEFESGFSDYPSLIYDGPFSDHIMERQPKMLQSESEISVDKAKEIASKALGIDVGSIKQDSDEEGKMPSYTFSSKASNEDSSIGITKAGGLISYMTKYREVTEQKLSAKDAIEKAKAYLSTLGVSSLKDTYYEISGNLITINFAHTQDNVICYTDLIKVSVAMDNGEILRYDGRGYITNHETRDISNNTISLEQAKEKLNDNLKIKSTQMCIIPTPDLKEVLCYELNCTSEVEDNVLVYINALTGEEEQVLILYSSETGVLTI